jgi:hypothetical protein
MQTSQRDINTFILTMVMPIIIIIIIIIIIKWMSVYFPFLLHSPF